jgi:transcriptional regulator with XRE-family HTH domain
MNSTRRAELAEFLRARRARLSPREAGLPEVGRRRTPGLRRQEVAQLAGLSVDYYIRLEQARGPHPSRQVLSALSRALAGPLEFECQVLHIADTGQRLIAYCAVPGSATEAAFRELAASAPLPI